MMQKYSSNFVEAQDQEYSSNFVETRDQEYSYNFVEAGDLQVAEGVDWCYREHFSCKERVFAFRITPKVFSPS
jgi:hypothetical protein